MKIKLADILKNDRVLTGELAKHDIQIDEESKYELSLNSEISKNTLMARTENNEITLVDIKDILYFESFDNSIFVVLKNERYKVSEKLYYYEENYCGTEFIRVSKSFIVNIKEVSKIKTSLNRKLILVMANNDEVDVNRSYYQSFKERLGI